VGEIPTAYFQLIKEKNKRELTTKLTDCIQLETKGGPNVVFEPNRLQQALISEIGKPQMKVSSTPIENFIISDLPELPTRNQYYLDEKG
jgi:hypothetical protein